MPRRKKLWGDRLVTAREVAKYSITDVHESTIRRWMKNGVTSFGMPLDVAVKNNHFVISLFQVDRLQKEVERRAADKFARVSEELEAELKSGMPLSRLLPLKLKTPAP
jgi:hypothetical protein